MILSREECETGWSWLLVAMVDWMVTGEGRIGGVEQDRDHD